MSNKNMENKDDLICLRCDCWNSDYECCIMSYIDRIYACPLYNKDFIEDMKNLNNKKFRINERNE